MHRYKDRFKPCYARLGETVDELCDLSLVVGSAVGVEAGAALVGSNVEKAEQLRHFGKGGILRGSSTDDLEACANFCAGSTVHSIGLFGLTQTLFARLMLRHLISPGKTYLKFFVGTKIAKIGNLSSPQIGRIC